MEKKRRKLEFTLAEFARAEHWAWEAFVEHQKASDEADILKEHSKDYLAVLMQKIEQGEPSKKWSVAELERKARASEEWRKFREGQFEAQRVAGERKVKYQSAIRFWETCQSGLSYRKAEMASKIGG